MSAAVKITYMDHTPGELRAIAARSKDIAQARRLLAMPSCWRAHHGWIPRGRLAWIVRQLTGYRLEATPEAGNVFPSWVCGMSRAVLVCCRVA